MKNLAAKVLSISIVNYNSKDYLFKCLESLWKVKDEINFDVWVLDNDSSDKSFEKAKINFNKFNYIKSQENLGFGKAHNQVMKKISTPYILFLNPDTEVLTGTLKEMVEFMEKNSDVGAASCKVIKDDGLLDWASHRGFPTPLASFRYYFLNNDSLYHLKSKNMDHTHEVDAISGAFFLTRKDVLEKVGGFDGDYFLYAEDIDLSFRIKKAGYKIMYVPQVKVIHHKGISSGIKSHSQHLSNADLEVRIRNIDSFYETMQLFYKKNLSQSYPFFINWLVYLGINLKWTLAKQKLTV